MERDTGHLRVFWQPGCTSCLAAKQFLASCGLEFESINVRERPQAMQMLQELGARSVPVVSRGSEWVYAQERRDLAAFLGVAVPAVALAPAVLAQRIAAQLQATAQFTRELPATIWEQSIVGRTDRTVIDIPFHIAQIAAGFLDAATDGELTYQHFERRPCGSQRAATAVVSEIHAVHTRFSAWRAEYSAGNGAKALRTYYGAQPLASVMERTAWHMAQHARQLEHVLVSHAVQPSSPLGDRELAGLPLPEGVWDAEIGSLG